MHSNTDGTIHTYMYAVHCDFVDQPELLELEVTGFSAGLGAE